MKVIGLILAIFVAIAQAGTPYRMAPMYAPVQQAAYKVPEYTMSGYMKPSYKMADYKMPAYKAPSYEMPTYKAPAPAYSNPVYYRR